MPMPDHCSFAQGHPFGTEYFRVLEATRSQPEVGDEWPHLRWCMQHLDMGKEVMQALSPGNSGENEGVLPFSWGMPHFLFDPDRFLDVKSGGNIELTQLRANMQRSENFRCFQVRTVFVPQPFKWNPTLLTGVTHLTHTSLFNLYPPKYQLSQSCVTPKAWAQSFYILFDLICMPEKYKAGWRRARGLGRNHEVQGAGARHGKGTEDAQKTRMSKG
ncbi:hypothetical protein GGX14DRAFT_404884 [Mycena pura]|uniref:Uncharacterized protein n=1 Tax=Mycena pura TaxID=153505 RepID=A0AAD6V030_9AGAR|nr:hypothetical protein GGX14DRAFT_404884 [Mycena pura]